MEWSLHGPIPKLCPVIPTFNQDGRQARNRKKGGGRRAEPLDSFLEKNHPMTISSKFSSY
jgi:hypothetical protein